MYLSMLMGTVALVASQPETSDDARNLAQTGAALIECVVAARAASEDPETEITLGADTSMAAYERAEALFRQVDEFVRSPAFQSQISIDPKYQFLHARSADFSVGYMLGQAEMQALQSLNREASEMLERDEEGLYDGFLDARAWNGFITYWDNECEAKLAEVSVD